MFAILSVLVITHEQMYLYTPGHLTLFAKPNIFDLNKILYIWSAYSPAVAEKTSNEILNNK